MKLKDAINEKLEYVILFILLASWNQTLRSSVRLAKIITILRFEHNLRFKIIWASLGPYPYRQNATLRVLEKSNLIEISKPAKDVPFYRFQLTEKGKMIIEGKLKEHSIEALPYIKEIRSLIKKDLQSLIEDATELFASNVGSKTIIGEHSIKKIFDWNKLGTGIWQPYNDSLLWCYMDLWKKNFSFKKAMSEEFPEYQKIPKTMNTKELNLEDRNFRAFLSKATPNSLKEDKIEGKNYIENKWFILEAINMIHALSGVMPSIKDLAWMCFSTFKLEIEKNPENNEFIKNFINKSHLRYAISELENVGVIKSFKYGKEHRYRVSANQFIDDFEGKVFKLMSEEEIEKKFQEFRYDAFLEGGLS